MIDKEVIDAAYFDLDRLDDAATAVEDAIAALDAGEIRVAEKAGSEWVVNEWVKRAILLYFRLRPMEAFEVGPFEWNDRIPTKTKLAAAGVRSSRRE